MLFVHELFDVGLCFRFLLSFFLIFLFAGSHGTLFDELSTDSWISGDLNLRPCTSQSLRHQPTNSQQNHPTTHTIGGHRLHPLHKVKASLLYLTLPIPHEPMVFKGNLFKQSKGEPIQ